MARGKSANVTFSSGEIGPELQQRSDTSKYSSGLARARNVILRTGGGAANRTGLEWVGAVRDESQKAIPVPFQFSLEQSYVLEFGHLSMRVAYRGAYVTEQQLLISSISNSNPVLVEVVAHGYATGDDVYLDGIEGMVELNGRTFRVTRQSADTFSLDGINGVSMGVYTGSPGGVVGDSAGGEGGNPPGGPVPPVDPPTIPDTAPEPETGGGPDLTQRAQYAADFQNRIGRPPYSDEELYYWVETGLTLFVG